MKVFLLHRDHDTDADAGLPTHHEALIEDLGLGAVFNVMAAGDRFRWDVARRVVVTSALEPDEIRYRQQVLADCLDNRAAVQRLYDIAVETLESRRKTYSFWSANSSPSALLSSAVRTLHVLLGNLHELRQVATRYGHGFRSAGFERFLTMVDEELDDEYLAEVATRISDLQLRSGQLVAARLGTGNKASYTLQHPPERRLLGAVHPRSRGAGFRVDSRDDHMLQALGELREQSINGVANAVAQSVDHVLAFFALLRYELAFYLGCVSLVEHLSDKGEPVCVPEPVPSGNAVISARGLYDVGLSLRVPGRVVGNDVDADGKALLMVTGANHGGKSTFLRALGLAQLMMQSGMPAPADAFSADVRAGVFTHFTREEDPTLKSGKLDEELVRMSAIVTALRPTSMLLCNESFASTNEQEGSEIARQVIRALMEAGVKVVFVTHLHDLAAGLHRARDASMMFLRAERLPDGGRTYRVREGEPLPTSHGSDSYFRIFGPRAAETAGA